MAPPVRPTDIIQVMGRRFRHQMMFHTVSLQSLYTVLYDLFSRQQRNPLPGDPIIPIVQSGQSAGNGGCRIRIVSHVDTLQNAVPIVSHPEQAP